MTPRRFPPPWTAEVTPNCFIVRDANGFGRGSIQLLLNAVERNTHARR